jgi:regulator of RNase E activity RraA
MQAGIQAVVTDAGVRDTEGLTLKKLPVWARMITPRSAGKGRVEYVEAMCPVQCNKVQIRPMDIVVGDSDGIVVVPSEVALEVQNQLEQNYKRGEFLLAEIDKGTDYPEAIKKLANLGGTPDWFK